MTIDARRARIHFAVVFGAVAGVLLTAYSFPYAAHGMAEGWFFDRYLSAYARIAGLVVRFGDPTVRVFGNQLVGGVSLTVAKNCDAMDVNILFVSAIVAFPAAWGRRAVGIAGGLALLIAANISRIVSLYYIGVSWPGSFEAVHAEVWPFAMVALAVSEFLLWSRWAVRPSRAEA